MSDIEVMSPSWLEIASRNNYELHIFFQIKIKKVLPCKKSSISGFNKKKKIKAKMHNKSYKKHFIVSHACYNKKAPVCRLKIIKKKSL